MSAASAENGSAMKAIVRRLHRLEERNMTSGYANAWKRSTGASQKLANTANYRRSKKNDH